jgi:orotidine-5'-phosphate decarboxylase
MGSYIERLNSAIRKKKTPALVGLDPRLDAIPSAILKKAGSLASSTCQLAALAFEEFCLRIIDTVAPLVPAVKPQAAFFEEYGPEGMTALGNVITYARQKGLIVICDAKRGDIGTTAEAYARGFLAGEDASLAPWGADALTVNPYLGRDTLEPFAKVCHERGAGLYVLVRTSNPGSASFQDHTSTAHDPHGEKLYQVVARIVEEMTQLGTLSDGYGSIGAVIGATYPEELKMLRAQMSHVPLLIPGYGTQGGTSLDTAAAFDAHGLGAVVNSSRGINFAYQKEPYKNKFGIERWEDAVEAATHDMIADLAQHTTAGTL